MPTPAVEPTWTPADVKALLGKALPVGKAEYGILLVVIAEEGVSTQFLALTEPKATELVANIEAHSLDITSKVMVRYGLLYAV